MLYIFIDYHSRTGRVYAVAMNGNLKTDPRLLYDASFQLRSLDIGAIRFIANARSMPEFTNPPRTHVMFGALVETKVGDRLKVMFTRLQVVKNPILRDAAKPFISSMAYLDRA